MAITKASSSAVAPAALGDLVVGSATNDSGILPIGTTGQVLTVAAGTASWATPGGSTQTFTLLNAGGTSLSSTLTTISGLSGYNVLKIFITAGSLSAGGDITLRFNGDANSKYAAVGNYIESSTSYNVAYIASTSQAIDADSSFAFGYNATAASNFAGGVEVMGANSTATKHVTIISGASGVNGNARQITNGIYTGTSVISSFSVRVTGGASFDAGTVYIYGAN